MKYVFQNNTTKHVSCNLMDVVLNPLKINLNLIHKGVPLFKGKTPYDDVTYLKHENPDFYENLSSLTLKDMLIQRTEILQNIYGKKDTAVLLSGGADSSVVSLLWRPQVVWTLDNGTDKDTNDTFYAKLLADKIKAKINLIRPQKDLKHLKKIVAKNGIISRHSGLFALDSILKEIKKAGYKNVLMGSHADYCFGHFKIGFVLELIKLIQTNPVFAGYKDLCQKSIGTPVQILLKLLGIDPTLEEEFCGIQETLANKLHKIVGICDDQEQYNECFLENYYGLKLIDPFKSECIENFAFSYDKTLDYNCGNPKVVLLNEFKHELPEEILNRTHKVGCSVPYWKWFPDLNKGNYSQLVHMLLTWHEDFWSYKHHE